MADVLTFLERIGRKFQNTECAEPTGARGRAVRYFSVPGPCMQRTAGFSARLSARIEQRLREAMHISAHTLPAGANGFDVLFGHRLCGAGVHRSDAEQRFTVFMPDAVGKLAGKVPRSEALKRSRGQTAFTQHLDAGCASACQMPNSVLPFS